MVTPYTSAFLTGPGVTNITLQNQCPLDLSDHLEIAADPVALADVLNALDPAHPVRVPCLVVLAITGIPRPGVHSRHNNREDRASGRIRYPGGTRSSREPKSSRLNPVLHRRPGNPGKFSPPDITGPVSSGWSGRSLASTGISRTRLP